MHGTESHGCGEHQRTSENAQDEILHNIIPLNSHQKRAKKAKTVANNYSSSAKEMNAQKIKLKVLNPFLTSV